MHIFFDSVNSLQYFSAHFKSLNVQNHFMYTCVQFPVMFFEALFVILYYWVSGWWSLDDFFFIHTKKQLVFIQPIRNLMFIIITRRETPSITIELERTYLWHVTLSNLSRVNKSRLIEFHFYFCISTGQIELWFPTHFLLELFKMTRSKNNNKIYIIYRHFCKENRKLKPKYIPLMVLGPWFP